VSQTHRQYLCEFFEEYWFNDRQLVQSSMKAEMPPTDFREKQHACFVAIVFLSSEATQLK